MRKAELLHPQQIHQAQKPKAFEFNKIAKDLFAGTVAGIAATISGHPLDTIRIRVQVLGQGAVVCTRSILQTEGALALYKGIYSPLTTVPLMQAVMFGSYEMAKRVQGYYSSDDMSISQILLAGAMTGLPFALGITPIDLVKCKLQMEGAGQRLQTTGTVDMAKKIVRLDGFRGLFRGLGICLLRDIPANAAQLGSYEFLKRKFRNIGLDYTTSCFISGGLANVFCWLVSYPMDIVKTRLQLKSGEKGRIRDQAKLIWKSKGFLGFYQGIGATLCRAIVSGSFNFCTYEMVKKLIYN